MVQSFTNFTSTVIESPVDGKGIIVIVTPTEGKLETPKLWKLSKTANSVEAEQSIETRAVS